MLSIQPLTGRHDRKAFDSGSALLDAWLRQTTRQRFIADESCDFAAVRNLREAGHSKIP